MFLLNSRLGRFSATPSCSNSLYFHTNGVPLIPKLRGYFAEFLNEGFLARLRILTLPTCVGLRYGHLKASLEVFLDSLGAATSLLVFTPRYLSGFYEPRFCLQFALLAWTRFSSRALGLPCCVTPSFKRLYGGIGFSTDCPSPTLFSLGLGPDLPWADEPSPGILRFSAGRIRTCLCVYLYRHSHFPSVHYSLRYSFNPNGNAPLPRL